MVDNELICANRNLQRFTRSPPLPETPVSYLDLPQKAQTALLCLARLVDPVAQTSIYAYLFHQVQHLLPFATIPEVATYMGVIITARTLSKVCTGVLWGRVADSRWGGRKPVLVIGLLTSCIACIGYGFATTITSAVLWQIFAGAMSSNVGITRCIVAEINPDRRLRARALLLLATFGNIGSSIGPLIGGSLLSDLDGKYPFALPNILVAVIYALAALGVALLLDETLEKSPEDALTFQTVWQKIRNAKFLPGRKTQTYSALRQEEIFPLVMNETTVATEQQELLSRELRLREIWTTQVLCTLFAQFVISAHITTFPILWIALLSTPVDQGHQRSLFRFGGGVGLTPQYVGLVMSALNGVGVLLQLFAYPWFNDRWNTLQIWHVSLMIFPLTYCFAPFPALVAASASSSSPGLTNNTSAAVWITIAGVLALNVIGRTGSIPSMTILINDCVPGPSARATINMAGMTSSQLSKTIFPVGILAIYGWGVQRNVVGLAFWLLSGLAVIAIITSRWVRSTPVADKKLVNRHEGNEAV